MRLHALPFLVGLFQFSKTVESIDSVTLGLQFPVFKVDTSYDGGGHDRFASALIAIDEINDKVRKITTLTLGSPPGTNSPP
jgi:hypothetical protein